MKGQPDKRGHTSKRLPSSCGVPRGGDPRDKAQGTKAPKLLYVISNRLGQPADGRRCVEACYYVACRI